MATRCQKGYRRCPAKTGQCFSTGKKSTRKSKSTSSTRKSSPKTKQLKKWVNEKGIWRRV